MDRRKRNSITLNSPSNKEMSGKEISIKNEELYIIDEAYGKLNEYPSPKHNDINHIDEIFSKDKWINI